MNTTTASYSSEHSWAYSSSRRCSTETVFSIQDKETDFVRDTSDTDSPDSDDERDVEYEPVTEPEDDAPLSDASGDSDNNIIATKIIAVSVMDDGDLEFADSEQTESDGSDSEMDLHDYSSCAQCHAINNNPIYRYCDKCFKMRKSLFPPRPKGKHKRKTTLFRERGDQCSSQDSGVEVVSASQELSQEVLHTCPSPCRSVDIGIYSQSCSSVSVASPPSLSTIDNENAENIPTTNYESEHKSANRLSEIVILGRSPLKRRAESADRAFKRPRFDDSDSDSDVELIRSKKSKSVDPEVKPLIKTISDPSLTIESVNTVKQLTKKAIANSVKEKFAEKDDNLCIICYSEPKSGVFVHGRIAHICCCYKCAVKVWTKAKRCPICNCRVSNVLRAVM